MLRLRLNGSPPCLCSEGELGHEVLSAVYVYPELTQFEGGGTDAAGDRDWNDDAGITRRSIDIRVQLCVTPRELIVALDLANRSRRRVRLDAAWQLSADFADLQEALSGKREQTAEVDTHANRESSSSDMRIRAFLCGHGCARRAQCGEAPPTDSRCRSSSRPASRTAVG